MGSPPLPTPWFVVAAAIALLILRTRLFVPKHSHQEPPLLHSRIPYVGHILGLFLHGSRYYEWTSAKCGLPIYTLPVLNSKIYVVTAPELVSAVYRNSKTLAFNPFIAQVSKRISGHDEATTKIIQHNLNGEGHGYVPDTHDGMVSALAPGPKLAYMVEPMLQALSTYLLNLSQAPEVELFTWSRRLTTMCTASAVYGPANPFAQNPEYCDLFWDFQHDLDRLMIDVFPRVLAPRGFRARSALGDAFQRYFEDYDHNKTISSAVTEIHRASNSQYGLSTWNQGRLQVSSLIGTLANSIPAVFYMIAQIYSDTELLQDLRNELETRSTSASASESNVRILRVDSVRENSPLLYSTWQELLRFHGRTKNSRFVREDTLLGNKYLLKKNMVVQIPMAVMHFDRTIWGDDASLFKPRRFLKLDSARKGIRAGGTSRTGGAYKPFGGGTSMCPGRHFVTLEVMALSASLILQFDIVPLQGRWHIPASKQRNLATDIFPPCEDTMVTVTKRQGYEDIEWRYQAD